MVGAVGVVGDAERAAYAARFGCDQVITRAEFAAAGHGRAAEEAEEASDVILDLVGGPTRLASLLRLAPHSRLAVYGSLPGSAPAVLNGDELLMQVHGRSALSYNSHLLSRPTPSASPPTPGTPCAPWPRAASGRTSPPGTRWPTSERPWAGSRGPDVRREPAAIAPHVR
ncbi:hypothetical protein [Streptomyces racemochromogenes]|uniref:hypothetical protein n=1 Tax=Streptomyces racemochromogenes TaxID=67353 RepID=UPI0035F0F2B1